MQKQVKQILIGFGNKAITYQCDNKQEPLPISNILSKLYELFKEEDNQINSKVPNGVETVKTGITCPFSSEKILSSLIQIGMPIELSVKTLETVIMELILFIEKNNTLSTKDIRKIVSETIRKIEAEDDFESGEWSYRYTRKYGHDNRRVEIYNYPNLGKKLVSYATISEIIKASFEKVIPKEAVASISRAHMDSMSKYVIEFINGCDLYYIDYCTLQAMIIELSRQPPHPWLMTKSTKDLLMKYDIEAICSNVNKINATKSVFEDETYCYSEIIHHSSSLILQKYEWFLGTEDFSSFYILREILKQYYTIDFMQAFQTTSSIQQLGRDLALAGYSIQTFYEMTTKIQNIIQTKSPPDLEIREILIKYADIAIDLAEKRSENDLSASIYSDWSKKNSEEILKNAYRILKTIFHGGDCKNLPIQNNMFRFVCSEMLQVNQRILKKQYICLYVDDKFDINQLSVLNSRKFYDYVDVILVFSDNFDRGDFLEKANQLTNNQYWFVPISKTDCLTFIQNKNPSKYFYDILTRNIV